MLKISFDKNYIYPLDKNHRFPMIKYELLPEQLIRENTCSQENFFSPNQILDKDVLLTHNSEYYRKFIHRNATLPKPNQAAMESYVESMVAKHFAENRDRDIVFKKSPFAVS